MTAKKQRKEKEHQKRSLIAVIVIVLLILVTAALVLFWWLNRNDGENADNGQSSSAAEEAQDTGSSIELEERTDASYERWLAAAVLTGISMEYPDFESVSFYFANETDLSDKASSAGIYVTFTVNGEEKCIRSLPLEAERNDAGTRDLSSEVINFASFDEVSASEIPAEYSAVEIADINELITQSARVMVYTH